MARKGSGKKDKAKLAKSVERGETARRRAKVRDLERQARTVARETVTGACRDAWGEKSAEVTSAIRAVRKQTLAKLADEGRKFRAEQRAAARIECAGRVEQAQAPILAQLAAARRDFELFAPQAAPRSRRLSTARERAAEARDEIRGNIAAQYPQYLAAWDAGGARRFTEGAPQERFERFIESMEESPSQALGAQSALARQQLRTDIAEQEAAYRMLEAQRAARGEAPPSSFGPGSASPGSAPASFSFGYNVAPVSSRRPPSLPAVASSAAREIEAARAATWDIYERVEKAQRAWERANEKQRPKETSAEWWDRAMKARARLDAVQAEHAAAEQRVRDLEGALVAVTRSAPSSFALAPVSMAAPSTRGRAPRSQSMDAVAAIVGEVPNWTSADPRQDALFALPPASVALVPMAPAPRSLRYDMPAANGDQVGMFGAQQYRLDDLARLRR